jgi:hypothetical protein
MYPAARRLCLVMGGIDFHMLPHAPPILIVNDRMYQARLAEAKTTDGSKTQLGATAWPMPSRLSLDVRPSPLRLLQGMGQLMSQQLSARQGARRVLTCAKDDI